MSIQNDKLMNLADGKVLYDDLRGRVENIVKIQDNQPAGNNQVWFETDTATETTVPTIDEFNSLSDILAPQYDDLTFPVAVGQHCIYNGDYYAANQAISASEDWTAAHWTKVTVDGETRSIKSAINDKATVSGTPSNGDFLVYSSTAQAYVPTTLSAWQGGSY